MPVLCQECGGHRTNSAVLSAHLFILCVALRKGRCLYNVNITGACDQNKGKSHSRVDYYLCHFPSLKYLSNHTENDQNLSIQVLTNVCSL